MPGALTLRELLTRYSFKTDTKPLKRIDNAVSGLKKKIAGFDRAVIGAFSTLAKVTAAASVAAGAAIIKLGSDAEESEAKFDAVFGDQGKSVRKWSQEVAKSMGRSEFKLREFASSLQDTFVPLGFARDTAAQLSMNLTELSSDVASFQNKSEADVMRDFQSALVGNHETVRKYGIIITQARLDKKIAAMKKEMPGFIKLSKEQQQVLARQKMIFEGTTDAQGDAHRTAGSFANQMRRVKAQVEDVAKKVGMKLMPVMAKWLKGVGDWIQANDELIRQKLQAFLEGMVEAFKTLGSVVRWVIEHWRTLAIVAGSLVAGRILFGIGKLVMGVVQLGGALRSVISGAQGAQTALSGATATGGRLAGVLGKVGAVGAALGVGWTLGTALDRWLGLSDKVLVKMRQIQAERSKALMPLREQLADMRQLKDRARQLQELRKKGVKSVELERGGERVALDQAGIARILASQAEKLGISKANQAAAIPNIIQQTGLAASAPAGGAAKTDVKVDKPTFQINVPPGTTAAQAQALGEQTTAALLASMRRAMGDVQR